MKHAALTFDDGPSEWTPAILDLLAEHEAHATFFVLGSNIADNLTVLGRTAREGHELGVHGWDHTPVDTMTRLEVQAALLQTYDLIREHTGQQPRRWRPPWHKINEPAAEAAEAIGLSYCGVTVDTYDVARTDDWIVSNVYRELHDRAIIGMHDGVANNGNQVIPHRENTVLALGRILRTLSGDYTFVTVDELLK